MAWKDVSSVKLAKSLGISAIEVREKQRLVELIITARKEKGISQAALAKRLRVSQGRIAQIESGIGTARMTFDLLLGVLSVLGYEYKIISKRVA